VKYIPSGKNYRFSNQDANPSDINQKQGVRMMYQIRSARFEIKTAGMSHGANITRRLD
jgi:hypothetical protein